MDRYSKVVLTIIAVALSAIVLQNAGVLPSASRVSMVSPAVAVGSAEAKQVQICGYDTLKVQSLSDWHCALVGY